RSRGAREWRIHFHVPLFLERLGAFRNTQPYLKDLLARVRATAPTAHLEVETYTWDVLPEEHRRLPIDDAIARELAWVRERLCPCRARGSPCPRAASRPCGRCGRTSSRASSSPGPCCGRAPRPSSPPGSRSSTSAACS